VHAPQRVGDHARPPPARGKSQTKILAPKGKLAPIYHNISLQLAARCHRLLPSSSSQRRTPDAVIKDVAAAALFSSATAAVTAQVQQTTLERRGLAYHRLFSSGDVCIATVRVVVPGRLDNRA
jgi:hypothetical protein